MLILLGCAKPPDTEREAAKAAMDAAVSAGADKYALVDLDAVTKVWGTAESQMKEKKYKQAKQSYIDAKAAFEKASVAVEAEKKAATDQANASLPALEESWKNLEVTARKMAKRMREKKESGRPIQAPSAYGTSESSREKMSVMKIYSLFTILGVLACLGMPEWVSLQQVDITPLVKARNPTFEQEVQKMCEESCLGNERKGWLHAVSYRKLDDRNYQVYVEARFRNRHHMDPIYLFDTKVSEEGDLFNHTVIVKTRGRIDKQTCVAFVEDIWVENDFRGIFATLVERERRQSQITTFKGCAEYLK